ncbi:MAG TPA: hypothetical protein VGW32_11055 [Pyrinomonadaceae bacterium]|nr:hypothetical protein [Pyrinomonadaceae bacterium]
MQIENCKIKIENLFRSCRSVIARAVIAGVDSHAELPQVVIEPDFRAKSNLHFSIFNFQFSILFSVLFLLSAVCLLPSAARAQATPDKMVASVTNGSRATPDLITYSDLVWQLALEPDTPSSERPSSAQLNRALRLVEDQLLILQEARKLPSADTTEANAARDAEVIKKRNELAQAFGSAARLEERMTRVGLTSEQLDLILRDRVMVVQYLDFRFRAFAVVTDREIQDRYNQRYGRLRNSGQIVPTLEQVSPQIKRDLMEEKIETEIDKFVDELREQLGTEIVVLNPV